MTTQATTQPQLSVNLDLVGAIFTWIVDNPGDTPAEETFQHEYVHDDVPAHMAAFIGTTGDVSAGGSNLTAQEREPTINSGMVGARSRHAVGGAPRCRRSGQENRQNHLASRTHRPRPGRALEYILNSAQGWDEGSPITWSVKKLIKFILDNL